MAISTGGLLGLAQNTGRRQSAQRDLNTLRQLHDFKRQGEAEEQQAEVAYQESLARVKAEASNLLEGDRLAINRKAKELQEGLRSKVAALGGSKKAFLRSGGISDLAEYRDKVVGSEEMQMYKNNKINMEKLLMIREKKMGHLINEKDMKSMTQYNATGQGAITYTGLLNEVDVDETLFEWGKEITPDDVLKSGSNRMAIMANYEIDTGMDYNPSVNDQDLKDYIKFKGYGGLGKNVAIINARIKKQAADKKKNATPTPTAAVTVSYLVGKTGEKSADDMSFEKAYGKDKLGDNVLGVKPDSGFAYGKKVGWSIGAAKYKLKGGATFAEGKAQDFAKNFYTIKELNDDGSMTIDPTKVSGSYDARGGKLTGISKGGWDENYVASDLVLGYKTMIDGEPQLIVESLDKNGEPDGQNLYKDGKIPNGSSVMLIRMKQKRAAGIGKDFSDRDWYQEVPVDSDIAQNMLARNFGPDNDLKQTQSEEQELATLLNQQDLTADKLVRAESEQIAELEADMKKLSDKTIAHGEKSLTVNSEYFRLLTSQFNHNGLNRNLLVQSFYQAVAEGDENTLVNVADGKAFDQAIEKYGLNDLLLDKAVSDEQFIDDYYKADLKEHPGDVRTLEFGELFKQIYKKNINPDKK